MKYFFDLGSHHGEGLIYFADKFKMDENWIIHTFEPNTLSFKVIENFQYKDLNIVKHNLGVWVEDTTLEFRAETTHTVNGGARDGAGSTFITGENWQTKSQANWGGGDYEETYLVKVIDFNSLLLELKNPEYIFVKIDIEGSEYAVIKRLIEGGYEAN
jgi:FkbM family methyltransferase